MKTSLNNRGDTIIEVVLSMALLTSILFIAWSITNRATQVMAGARERITMVNQVKEQAELIKSSWVDNQDFSASYADAGTLSTDPCQDYSAGGWSVPGGQAWHIGVEAADTDSPVIKKNNSLKKVEGVGEGYVWVQKIKDTSGNFTDFYVRGCWINNLGSNEKTENTQLVVRLNT